MTKPILKPHHQRTISWRKQQPQTEKRLDADALRQQSLQKLQSEQPAKFAQLLRLLDVASTAPVSIIDQGIRSIENALIVQQSRHETDDR